MHPKAHSERSTLRLEGWKAASSSNHRFRSPVPATFSSGSGSDHSERQRGDHRMCGRSGRRRISESQAQGDLKSDDCSRCDRYLLVRLDRLHSCHQAAVALSSAEKRRTNTIVTTLAGDGVEVGANDSEQSRR